MIHARASAASLGLLRVWVFGLLAVIPLLEGTAAIASLPLESFRGPGILGLLPGTIWSLVLTPAGVGVLLVAVVGGSLVVATGVFPSRRFTFAISLLILLEQGIVRGFSGHINHAELVLVYSAFILSFFPIFDAITLRKEPSVSHNRSSSYRAPFVLIMILFTFSFSFAGAARISEGFDVFTEETLRNLMISRWMESLGQFSPNQIVAAAITTAPSWLLKLAYLITTLAELAAPLFLWNRPLRLAFVVFALGFHVVNLVLLGVTFLENIALLVVFSEVWFHRLASAVSEGEPVPMASMTVGVSR